METCDERSIVLEKPVKRKRNMDMEGMEFDLMMRRDDMRRFAELVDATNSFSGIILKKAELDKNFNKVYSQAIKKIAEFQFFNFENEFSHNNFLEIFGESGS